MKYSEKWINCNCGNRLGGTYVGYGYIFACRECGRVHRGGWWILTWLWGLQPTWFLVWRGTRRMRRFLNKVCREMLI